MLNNTKKNVKIFWQMLSGWITIHMMGPNMIGVPRLNLKDSLQGFPNSFLFSFSHDMSYISPFFLMSNEIIFFQILYRPLKYLLFSLMKVRILKFIQCGPCSINVPKLPKFWLLKTFSIMTGHLVLVTFIHFIHISTWGVCGKNLKQKKIVWTFFMN
jgi:hypothetical protein